MADLIVRYVPHRLVSQYEAKGWVRTEGLRGTYHGQFVVLMRYVQK